jgi:hypothetical protein
LFEDGGALQRFDLIDVARTSTGILLLGYRKREQSPSVS